MTLTREITISDSQSRAQSTEIFNKLRDLSFAILEVLIMGMILTEKESAEITRIHEGPVSQLRLLHYLPLNVDHQVIEEAKRLPAHTDWR